MRRCSAMAPTAAPSDAVADSVVTAGSPVRLFQRQLLLTEAPPTLLIQTHWSTTTKWTRRISLTTAWLCVQSSTRKKLPACRQDEAHVCIMPAVYYRWQAMAHRRWLSDIAIALAAQLKQFEARMMRMARAARVNTIVGPSQQEMSSNRQRSYCSSAYWRRRGPEE